MICSCNYSHQVLSLGVNTFVISIILMKFVGKIKGVNTCATHCSNKKTNVLNVHESTLYPCVPCKGLLDSYLVKSHVP